MSLTTRILGALAAGLVLGALLADWAPGGPLTTADVVGALWLNALRMTIVPLVFAMLVTGAATAAATVAAGGIAARALATFVVLLVASAVFGAVATEVLLAWSPIRPEGMAAIRAGLDAAGALLHYVLVIVAICLMLTLAMYVLAMLARLDVRAFAGAAAAGQAVAFSTQSSLAALPAMVEGAQQHLGVPSRVTGLVLPLAVSLFR
jgi:Na+/H+-dicarboxylate symporter